MTVTRPNRASHRFVQHINGPAQEAFPLYCPVREMDWISRWLPEEVYSTSGLAEPECVFVTRDGEADAVWIITRHCPQSHHVQMVKTVPQVTVCLIDIRLQAVDATHCTATVRYSHTSLGPKGDELVAGFDENYYQAFMTRWESAMNHYLATGERL